MLSIFFIKLIVFYIFQITLCFRILLSPISFVFTQLYVINDNNSTLFCPIQSRLILQEKPKPEAFKNGLVSKIIEYNI